MSSKYATLKNIKNTLKIPGFRRVDDTSEKSGLPPGILVHVGEQKTEKTDINLIDFNESNYVEIKDPSLQDCQEYKTSSSVTWIEVYGFSNLERIEELGRSFDVHPLALEDILNTKQRPKFEEFENHQFITLKDLSYNTDNYSIEIEQISILLGQGWVISFHEAPSNLFELIRLRLNNSKLRIRKREADYLAYALIDCIVDNYFSITERLGEQLEDIEAVLLEQMDQQDLRRIFDLKKNLTSIRKNIRPVHEVITKILDEEYPMINDSTMPYFRDIRDHVQQVIDSLDSHRETASNIIDTYLSLSSMKLNEVMKVLTIAATIFLPLTFIAGLYGMNFKFMPELEWHWGYFGVLGMMLSLMVAMVIYFKRKKWL